MTQSDRPDTTGPIIGSSSPVIAPLSASPQSGSGGAEVHKPAGDTEEVYFEGSPLLRGEIGRGFFWILIGVVLMLTPALVWFFTHQFPRGLWWLWIGCVVIGLIVVVVPFLRAKTVRYRITNYRIDLEKGIVGRTIETIELWHVEDLRFHQSLADRLLGIGAITIISKHPAVPFLMMRSLPNAERIFKTLEQRVIAVKRASGVIKVDSGS